MRTLANARPSGTLMLAAGAMLGIGLIAFGTVRLGSPTSAQQSTSLQPDIPLSRLVTAGKPIARGQLIKAGDLKTTLVFGAPPPHSIVAPAQAIGRIATVDIQPQQLILTSLISSDPAAAGLAMLVPVGQRVISIDTTDEIAVGGFLRPGDSVDIEIVLPSGVFGATSGVDRGEAHTLLQNIKVLTVGPTLDETEPEQDGSNPRATPQRRSLTVAMLPEQLGPFTLARQIGRFYLVLRNPGDEVIVPPGRTGLASLRGGDPAPRRAEPSSFSAPRRQPAPAPRPVELIVGGERQIIYPGKGR